MYRYIRKSMKPFIAFSFVSMLGQYRLFLWLILLIY